MDNEITPVILAAGKGSRLGSAEIPKPMHDVGGRPMMQDIVQILFSIGFGIENITTVIGYEGEKIKAYFGDDLKYYNQETLNGNAGALEPVLEGLKDSMDGNLLVIQGDDATQATRENLLNLIQVHLSRNSDMTILTVNRPDDTAHRFEYTYNSEGRISDIIPRETIDSSGRYTAGIYLFSLNSLRECFSVLKEQTPEGKELGIADLIRIAIEKGKEVFQVLSEKEYISVNTPQGLQKLRER